MGSEGLILQCSEYLSTWLSAIPSHSIQWEQRVLVLPRDVNTVEDLTLILSQDKSPMEFNVGLALANSWGGVEMYLSSCDLINRRHQDRHFPVLFFFVLLRHRRVDFEIKNKFTALLSFPLHSIVQRVISKNTKSLCHSLCWEHWTTNTAVVSDNILVQNDVWVARGHHKYFVRMKEGDGRKFGSGLKCSSTWLEEKTGIWSSHKQHSLVVTLHFKVKE